MRRHISVGLRLARYPARRAGMGIWYKTRYMTVAQGDKKREGATSARAENIAAAATGTTPQERGEHFNAAWVSELPRGHPHMRGELCITVALL